MFLKGIAHRGYHNETITENSLNAFKLAIDNKLAFELDVHLTKDGELIVFHDYDLKRVTGKEGIVEELTFKEIRENYALFDGEKIPTFKEVLELTKEAVPIVVEIKPYKKNFEAIASKLKEDLSVIKDKRNINIISFDPRALFPFKNSGYLRSLLYGDTHKWVFHLRFLFESMDIDVKLFDQKKIQRYAKNHFVNCWTVDSIERFEFVYPYADTVTFQYIDCEIIKKRLEEKHK